MLNKLVDSLKESLPEPLRKKLGLESAPDDSVEHEEHSEEESEESHDTSDNETPPEDKKKKQFSNIIRVVVILGLGYLALDQFVLKSDNSETEVANVPIKPRRKKPVPPKPAEPAAEKPTEAAPGTTPADAAAVAANTEGSAPPAQPPVDTVPPVENINIADKKIDETTAPAPTAETATDAPPAAAPETAAAPGAIVEAPVPEVPPAATSSEAHTPPVGEVSSSEAQIEKSIDSLIDSVDGTEKKQDETEEKKETKLEDKIVADDIYTAPPAYDQIGRGLVYNCKEKHWACVDKSAYVLCNKNMSWNKSKGKAAECVVQNVYNSDDDCNTIQKYHISTSKPTPFCQ